MQNHLKSLLTQTATLKGRPFSEMLRQANGLDRTGFKTWLFCQGMQFNSLKKWWGDHARRDYPHEGIDLCLYRNRLHEIQRLHTETLIPAIGNGMVKTIFPDFLGMAIIIEHESLQGDHRRLLSIYAHTRPQPDIHNGAAVKRGDIIATLAHTGTSKTGILPHLHFSLGLSSPNLSYDRFVWNIVRKPEQVALLNPLEYINFPHQMCDRDHPYCLEL